MDIEEIADGLVDNNGEVESIAKSLEPLQIRRF